MPWKTNPTSFPSASPGCGRCCPDHPRGGTDGLGQKIKWMRQNPKVCLQTDEIGDRSNWTSVVVNGTYLELREPQYTSGKKLARERLAKVADWWRTPLAERRERATDLSIEPVFFHIDIASMSGLRGLPESG